MGGFFGAVLLFGTAFLSVFWCSSASFFLLGCFYLSLVFFCNAFTPATFFITVFYFFFWALLSLPTLRKTMFSNRFFNFVKKVLPPISKTESDAIKAGTVWWDAQIFSGKPDMSYLASLPTPTLTEEEQDFLDNEVNQFCSFFTEWDTYIQKDMPPEAWAFIKEKGFLGIIIPKEYGGKGFSAYAHALIVRKIASHCCAAVIHVMVPNSLGPGELLLNYGTEEQKQKYLPRLAKGLELPAFALTGTQAGSDAGAMPDQGIVCKGVWEGKTILGMRLTWDKRYITLGPVATLLGLAFKLYDPDHLLGDVDDLGITCALIPTDTPGIQIGRRHYPLNGVFQNGPNSAKDLFVPLDFIIGGPAMAGQGWRMLMECLSAGRGISLPNTAIGSAQTALFSTSSYARVRYQFHLPISFFEGIQIPLARMVGYLYIMRSVARFTAIALDMGEKPSVISAICKYHLTEMQRQVVTDAMDIQGGKAICSGPRNYIARAYTQLPVSITVEGANILTRCLIIFGQGAIRCHPYILQEMMLTSSEEQDSARKEFDVVLFKHIAFAVRNTVYSFWQGLCGSRLIWAIPSSFPSTIRQYVRHFLRFSSAFSMVSDFSMLTIGGNMKRREGLSSRLGDVLSYLFMISSVFKNYQMDGCSEEDLPLVRWSLDWLFYNLQEAFYDFFANFPFSILSKMMAVFVFPLGRVFKKPTDALSAELAKMITSEDFSQRDALFDNMFLSKDPKNALAQLDKTFRMVFSADVIYKKFKKVSCEPWHDIRTRARFGLDQGLINSSEYEFYLEFLDHQDEVLKVDDFSQDLT